MATSSDGDAGGGGGYPAARFTSEDVDSANFVSQQLILVEARGMSPATAARVLLTNECEECHCVINELKSPNCAKPACPCHCECCCPPMAACLDSCKCKCACHYSGGRDDEIVQETSQSGTESTEGRADVAIQAPAQGQTLPTSVGAATANGKQEDGQTSTTTRSNILPLGDKGEDAAMSDGEGDPAATTNPADALEDAAMGDGGSTDEGDRDSTTSEMSDDSTDNRRHTESPEGDFVMTQVRLPDNATPSQLYAEIVNERAAHVTEDNPRYDRMIRLLFKRAYEDAVPPTLTKAKEDHLPTLDDEEVEELKALLAILLDNRKYSLPRLLGVLKEVSKASSRSSWTLVKILRNRAAAARLPDSAPANVWTKQSTGTPAATTSPAGQYEFDPTVYSAEEITALTILSEQPQVFPEKTRKPSPDEWKVIMGMIQGSILAKALPQFLKRCATMIQVAWIHRQIMIRAEGELWTKLPALSKMYNFNQSSKRLISEPSATRTQDLTRCLTR